MNIDNIWNKFLSTIKTKLSSLSYDTWFSTSKLVELNEEHAVIIVPTIAHKKHLSESYIDIISDIFNSITGTNFNFEFVLENEYNNKNIKLKKIYEIASDNFSALVKDIVINETDETAKIIELPNTDQSK